MKGGNGILGAFTILRNVVRMSNKYKSDQQVAVAMKKKR
jgi:hypothetical protein